MKVLIFDSGTLINLSMNGLLYIVKELKKNFDGKFIITEAVKYEVIDHPMEILRFELGALRVKNLLDEKIIELPSAINIDKNKIKEETIKLMNLANHYIKVRGQWTSIISEAETSCLALSSELTKKGIQNIIAIDERTTRIFCENPLSLKKLMSDKLHEQVEVINADLSDLLKYRFIRSSEMVFVAYKKGLIKLKGKRALEALLYATKFKGAAISFEEIEELKRL